jgi:drug/metabolite transporter (DMT)-like permease
MATSAHATPSLRRLWPIAIAIAGLHFAISFLIFAWALPRSEAGLPDSRILGVIMSVLCFPMILVARLDHAQPRRFPIPDYVYPLTWGLSSLFWGVVVMLIVYFYRRRQFREPTI